MLTLFFYFSNLEGNYLWLNQNHNHFQITVQDDVENTVRYTINRVDDTLTIEWYGGSNHKNGEKLYVFAEKHVKEINTDKSTYEESIKELYKQGKYITTTYADENGNS